MNLFPSRHPERGCPTPKNAVILSEAVRLFPAAKSKDLHCSRRVAPAIFPLMVLASALALPAQSPLFHDPSQPAAKQDQVQFLYPEQVTVAAGKPESVTLHFRIANGLHINSHTPSDKFLIPTVLTLPANAGVRLDNVHYPDGVEFILPVDPSTKLNVYTGDFAIETHLVATPGDHLIQARLRFQACDENACMPPRTITAPIDVIAH